MEISQPTESNENNENTPTTNLIRLNVKKATFQEKWCNKSSLSNCTSFTILLTGAILTYTVGEESASGHRAARYILSFGLFAFSGGITNWLAVKMLFDKVIFLYGSGVIPNRFVEIREALKEMIMTSFFDEEHMRGFVKENINDVVDIEKSCYELIDSPKMSAMMDEKLNEQLQNPLVALMMAGFGIQNPTSLIPLVKPMLMRFAKGMVPEIQKSVQKVVSEAGDAIKLREQIDKLLEDRLQYLTAEAVKEQMEDVIRMHLHWLVIWGNVFGGFIGLISAIANWPGGQC